MSNQWFRMYAEFANDPKVCTMPETFQLRFVRLLCLRCSGPTEKMRDYAIQYALQCNDIETFHETKTMFLERGFIAENWEVLNWNKRQYVSDVSTNRVRKHREKQAQKQYETFHETRETQNETHQNRTEQNRTEQIQSKNSFAPSAKKPALKAEPIPVDHLAGTLPLVDGTEYEVSKDQIAEWASAFPAVDVRQKLMEMKAWIKANPGKRKTRKGICRFVVQWLGREQDKGGKMIQPAKPIGGNYPTGFFD